jgi:hypothetical protein
MTKQRLLDAVLARVAALETEARTVLSAYEESPARVVTLQASYKRLSGLSLEQDELFREALRATEGGLFRAAHVLAWAGFIDFLHGFLLPAHAASLQAVRPAWKVGAPEDMREQADFQVIEAGKDAGVYTKTLMKALHGLLNRRNECAHPSEYFPDLNQTLGYISELFARVEQVQKLQT